MKKKYKRRPWTRNNLKDNIKPRGRILPDLREVKLPWWVTIS